MILNYQKDTPPGTGFRSQVIPSLQGSLDPYTANSQRGNDLGTDRDVYGATVLGDFVLNDNWSLSTITGWRRYDGLDKFDADGSQADLIEFDERAEGRQFSQEFRFNYDGGGKFTGFLGTSFFDETAERELDYQADERQLYALLSPQINGNTAALLGPALANYYFPIVPLLNANATPNVSRTFTWLPVPGLGAADADQPGRLPADPAQSRPSRNLRQRCRHPRHRTVRGRHLAVQRPVVAHPRPARLARKSRIRLFLCAGQRFQPGLLLSARGAPPAAHRPAPTCCSRRPPGA